MRTIMLIIDGIYILIIIVMAAFATILSLIGEFLKQPLKYLLLYLGNVVERLEERIDDRRKK